jgi:hypothetical protein
MEKDASSRNTGLHVSLNGTSLGLDRAVLFSPRESGSFRKRSSFIPVASFL